MAPLMWFYKILLAHSFVYMLSMIAFALQWQSWVVARETVWSMKLFIVWPFTEDNSCEGGECAWGRQAGRDHLEPVRKNHLTNQPPTKCKTYLQGLGVHISFMNWGSKDSFHQVTPGCPSDLCFLAGPQVLSLFPHMTATYRSDRLLWTCPR